MQCDLTELRTLFSGSTKAIAAVGDETRQSIIMALMKGPEEGMRVGAITAMVNLSAPAVSHHLKVLREAGIVAVAKQGTMNFYRLNPDRTAIMNIRAICEGILSVMDACEAT